MLYQSTVWSFGKLLVEQVGFVTSCSDIFIYLWDCLVWSFGANVSANLQLKSCMVNLWDNSHVLQLLLPVEGGVTVLGRAFQTPSFVCVDGTCPTTPSTKNPLAKLVIMLCDLCNGSLISCGAVHTSFSSISLSEEANWYLMTLLQFDFFCLRILKMIDPCSLRWGSPGSSLAVWSTERLLLVLVITP